MKLDEDIHAGWTGLVDQRNIYRLHISGPGPYTLRVYFWTVPDCHGRILLRRLPDGAEMEIARWDQRSTNNDVWPTNRAPANAGLNETIQSQIQGARIEAVDYDVSRFINSEGNYEVTFKHTRRYPDGKVVREGTYIQGVQVFGAETAPRPGQAPGTPEPNPAKKAAAGKSADSRSMGEWLAMFSALFLGLLTILWMLVTKLEKLEQYKSEAVAVSAFVLAGLLAAVVLFGMMRSYGHVSGKKLGVAFEFGGPAALFVGVVGGGLYYQYQLRETEFNLAIYFEVTGAKNIGLTNNGHFYLLLDRKEAFPISDGVCYLYRIPSRWKNQNVQFSLDLPGYEPARGTNLIRLEPDARNSFPVRAVQPAEAPSLPRPLTASAQTRFSPSKSGQAALEIDRQGQITGEITLENDTFLLGFDASAHVLFYDVNTNKIAELALGPFHIDGKPPGKAIRKTAPISTNVDRSFLPRVKQVRLELFGG